MSIGQLVEKGYNVDTKNGKLHLSDSEKRLVFKANLTKNRTFQVNMKAAEIKCFAEQEPEEECWTWHSRYGHLNFKSLHQLGAKHMVSGLPVTNFPQKVCEVCMTGKQTRKFFSITAAYES